jgi:uncharacterized protein (TIGR02391 family)
MTSGHLPDTGIDGAILNRMADTLIILQARSASPDRGKTIAALEAIRDQYPAGTRVLIVEGESEERMVREWLAALERTSLGTPDARQARARATAGRVAGILARHQDDAGHDAQGLVQDEDATVPMPFGAELRQARMSSGVSLRQLGEQVRYSKSQLSKIENGMVHGSLGLARACDEALGADGRLTRAFLANEARENMVLTGENHMRQHSGGEIVPRMTQATVAPAPPPPFSSAVVEHVCQALAEAVTGSQIPGLIAAIRVTEDPGAGQPSKWTRLYNAVAERQNRQQDGRPLLRLVAEVLQPVRFATSAGFDEARARVNERLLLAGYRVREDGKVSKAPPAATIGEAQQRADDLRAELTRRGVHPEVLRFCRAELTDRDYFHAVLEAAKSVADRLRAMTGVNGDTSGLVDATCSMASGPRVAFNSLSAEWEESEQKGIAMLMKGLFSTFRNPAAHAPRITWATSRNDALDMLTLASMLHRRLDRATVSRP